MTSDRRHLGEAADELALGLLTGVERAEALAHLEECRACRSEVAALSDIAEEVLLLAPPATPDPGFVDRVLDRIDEVEAEESAVSESSEASEAQSNVRQLLPRRRRRVRLLVAAAAAAIALVAGAVGLPGSQAPPALAAAMIDGRGHVVGRVSLDVKDGTEIAMDLPGWEQLVQRYNTAPSSRYWAEVRLDDGSKRRVALAYGDSGDWQLRVKVDRSEIAAVAIVDSNRVQWCQALFV